MYYIVCKSFLILIWSLFFFFFLTSSFSLTHSVGNINASSAR